MKQLITRLGRPIKNRAMSVWSSATGQRMISFLTMPERDFLRFFDVNGVSAALAQNNVESARDLLLTHYRDQVKAPGWAKPPNVIADLDIQMDKLTSKKLIATADSVLGYRFPDNEASPVFDTDGKICWDRHPTASKEWLWKLNRHQWWPVLGLAYSSTKDERYAEFFVSQMLDWIERNPPPSHKNEMSAAWRLMEAALRMRISWIPSFALFFESPRFTEDAKLMMLRSICDHGKFICLFKSRQNHLIREINGLACVGTNFPEFREAERWCKTAIERLEQELTLQFNQDGSHIEVSTGYQWLVVDELEVAFDLFKVNGLSVQKEKLASWLEKIYSVMLYLVRPDGSFPEINDGFLTSDYTYFKEAGRKLNRDDFIFVGTAGRQGSQPTESSVAFHDAGFYTMRSDWTNEARYLLFDAGPYGGFHGHEDKLSIEVSAFGRRFIVDSGSYTYNEKDPFRKYFVSSQAHNTVLVDGQSQIRRWHAANLFAKPVSGNDAIWVSEANFDYVAAAYREGYGDFNLQRPEKAKVIGDVNHTRHILFVKPDYWVIVDELNASAVHSYQFLFHADPEIGLTVSKKRAILGTQQGGPCLHIVPADHDSLEVSRLFGSVDPIQGWYGAGYHKKLPAHVVIYEQKNRSSTIVTMLLYPCFAGQTGIEAEIEPLEISFGKGLAYIVNTSRGSDYLMFSQNDALKKFGNFHSKGIVAGVRTNKASEIIAEFDTDGT